MFTFATESLAAFRDRFGLGVVRDCSFAFVGKIPQKIAPRLVGCVSAHLISDACAFNGISGIVTLPELSDLVPDHLGLAISEAPIASLYQIHEDIARRPDFQWKSFDSWIHPSATVHNSAVIAPRNVRIGENSIIGENAVICPRTLIGDNCGVGPGTVIGSEAFEVNNFTSPRRVLYQSGGVMLGNDVEVQAKCTIVRATFGGFTLIGDETKLDCQIHVAHDCQVGKRVQIAACAELSGRVSIGDGVFIGPNATISNGVSIGEGATVTLGSVVVRDVPASARVTGNFALPHTKWLDFIRSIR
ncbi:UDP-3-O-(3-hydroxymyristoyl)glucosamine N-acyltransferase [Roseibium sp. RKSG952]|uniref:UDP-3-O-(3-hydroxymyristoyl)glucosamine N-acyltransferase n=1 Tax=Roseibium sp. RKSG952 TaxID=2529384 RepID=UPI0012BB6648|nr:UDP-3-O-(3-hydroxymyristoyl)glucosamine N-acyltransferase [Roseibium sp. RKSG952]MTH95254.1 hypothetical protein [Roseibium sp. RKSG952]